jgi:hypothetical protein
MVDDFIVMERSVEFPSRRVFRHAGRDVSLLNHFLDTKHSFIVSETLLSC